MTKGLFAIATGLFFVLALNGCGKSGPVAGSGNRAVVIGIDSADWRLLDTLIAEGGMPNLKSLKERGSWGEVLTLTDIPLSPVVWTSVATGKAPAKHGITWFLVDQPDGTRIPVRSTNRKTDAIWNIVDRAGLSSATIGWWATYPAEQLSRGMIVSDAVGVHGFGSTSRDSASTGKVHPENLHDRIDSLMPVEQQVTADFAQRFMHMSVEEYDRMKFDPARMARPHPMNPIHLFQQYVVTAQGYTRIAEQLLEEEEFALAMLYFEQTDSFSHLFMKYDEPKLDWVEQESFERYKDLVREWYRYQDQLLGRVLAKIDLETTAVILVSDHGFKIGDRRIRSDQTVDIQKAHLDHEKEGIFLAVGPHIRRGHEIQGASVIDVTPTVLHYLGLPVGKDMDGKVLSGILEPDYAAAHPIEYVQTHETGQRAKSANVNMSAADARDAEAGLRQLGYIGSDDPNSSEVAADDDEGAASASSPEIHNNLGRIYLGQGEVDLARAEFERALALDPNNAEALLNMGSIQQSLGRVRMAQHYAERALAVNPNSVGALAQLAEAKVGLMQFDEAARLYKQALAINEQPNLFLGLGDVLQRAGSYVEAEEAFKRVLQLDPDSFPALYNLGVTAAQQGKNAEAIAHYNSALRKNENHPSASLAMNNLGALLLAEGRADEALEKFEAAAARAPGHLEARFNAAVIHLEKNDLESAIPLLEEAKALAPNHEQVSTQLGLACLQVGRIEEAHKHLLLVRRLYPANWRAGVGFAAVLAGSGDAENARLVLAECEGSGGSEALAFATQFGVLEALKNEPGEGDQ